jgi:CBS domain containing-hemolysin-like protein
LSEFLAIYAKSPHIRYPLYDKTLDNIRGFVPIKDVLYFMATNGMDSLKEPLSLLMRPVVVVPVFKLIGELFEEMQEQGLSLAVVVDEYGATVGMVTPHGLLEKIVGRLRDEAAIPEPVVSQIDKQTVMVDAQVRIEEVNSELCLELPENPAYETLAGLILYDLKRLPQVGEELVVTNVHLTVAEMVGTKIEKVVIKKMKTEEEVR